MVADLLPKKKPVTQSEFVVYAPKFLLKALYKDHLALQLQFGLPTCGIWRPKFISK